MSAPARRAPDGAAGERDMLAGWLDFHRATLHRKVDGVDAEGLRRAPVPSRLMTLGGLVRHLTDVERWWFGRIVAGDPAAAPAWSDAEPDADWVVPREASAESLLAAYARECERSRHVLAQVGLDEPVRHDPHGRSLTVRWVVTHVIEETARHNGHADLLREVVDGATGA